MILSRLLPVCISLTALCACGGNKGITPQHRDITEMVFASGVLEAYDQYNLTAQQDGYLVQLKFNEGDLVNKGQPLAVIDNHQNILNARSAEELHGIAARNTQPNAPALLQIQANIQSAEAKLQLDQQQADRYQRLYQHNSVSRLEYENAQLAAVSSKAALDALREQYNNQKINAQQQEVSQRFISGVNQVTQEQNQIKAVTSGRIYQKQKQLGDYVRKGDVIAVIGDPELIYAKLNVDETNMAKLKEGQPVVIRLNTNKSKTYQATIHQILPSFDAASQSFLVKAYFTDSLDFRIAGTQLEANVITGEKKNALVIPRAYLQYGNTVLLKKGRQKTTVQTGIVSSDWVEILGGINENTVLIQDNK
ncbi:RND family efflux transporter, MFP subunit [Chitinophaga costaii]|uniref:RND family efflux transporter, MFP subunit n=1 Tax=Chitinophaga costaii TaxID=1335309 RepID=A0A1C4EGE4_9BACT|nr:HlyD family efflux transporter periplasmic adaptor subunit [Chitinophaga costaii]PUZ23842.1 transporter [Chitinophaga costaii]SCC42611.1 RND family efflux transporter, MFP subunit [Chitinophaga costaii]